MSDKISGRQCDSNVIVSTGPDVCLTPVGSSLVPVAYTSVAFAGDSTRVSPTVLDNEDPDFHLNSRVCTSTGHEPGVGAGVVSPGYQGEAFVQTASPTVFTDGWASTRHRDPAMINRPGSGAVEPQIERTGYYEQILRRIAGREEAETLEACYAEEVEQCLPARDLEPGTNESIESANGAAMLVTGATAPPEEDYRRRPGETQDEYFERLRPIINDQHRGEGLDPAVKAQQLESITEAIVTDPDYHAWAQGIDPALFHDPLATDGVFHNELLSRTATGHPADMEGMMRIANPWDFVGDDGNVYSTEGGGPAIMGSRPSAAKGTLLNLDQRFRTWMKRAGTPVPEDYELSSRTVKAARASAQRAQKMGTAIRGGGGKPFNPMGGLPQVTVPLGF